MIRKAVLVGFVLLAFAVPVVAADIPDDPALSKSVTLAVKGEALSEVVKMLQNQTGVHLAASQEIADQKVTIFIDKKPLKELMKGIMTVFGYKWATQTVSGSKVYQVSEPKQARIDRETAWQNFMDKAWTDVDTKAKKRAALEVNPSELQAEIERFEAVAKSQRSMVWSEHETMMRKRDTPVAASMCGDLAASRLYCHLSGEAMAALRAGSILRFDSQSSDPEWELPADVVEYLSPFVRTEEWVRPALQRSRELDDRAVIWDDYAVTLQASVNENGLVLRTEVLPRKAVPEESKTNASYVNIITPEQPEFLMAVSQTLPRQTNDAYLRQDVIITAADIGDEAHTTAWGWDSNYYASRSDMLALLHSKLGVQIISDHYTFYLMRDQRTVGTHYIWQLLEQIANSNRWGWDGKYVYMRDSDVRNADAQEVPNRLLRNWQAAYAKQGYLGLDEFAQIAQLSHSQLGPLRRYARLLGLDSIDWFCGWTRCFESPYVKLYGTLTDAQRKAALEHGTPVEAFTAEQRHLLEQILAANSGYEWRRFKARGPSGKIAVGIFDNMWRRLDKPDDPMDIDFQGQPPVQSKPISLAIHAKQGEAHYYWFNGVKSQWPKHPESIYNATDQDEAFRLVRNRLKSFPSASVKLIGFMDYNFVITLADGKSVQETIHVPLAPVTLTDSGPSVHSAQ